MDDRLRTQAQLWAWRAMRMSMPREHWSVTACDAITDAVLEVTQHYPALPPEWARQEKRNT